MVFSNITLQNCTISYFNHGGVKQFKPNDRPFILERCNQKYEKEVNQDLTPLTFFYIF